MDRFRATPLFFTAITCCFLWACQRREAPPTSAELHLEKTLTVASELLFGQTETAVTELNSLRQAYRNETAEALWLDLSTARQVVHGTRRRLDSLARLPYWEASSDQAFPAVLQNGRQRLLAILNNRVSQEVLQKLDSLWPAPAVFERLSAVPASSRRLALAEARLALANVDAIVTTALGRWGCDGCLPNAFQPGFFPLDSIARVGHPFRAAITLAPNWQGGPREVIMYVNGRRVPGTDAHAFWEIVPDAPGRLALNLSINVREPVSGEVRNFSRLVEIPVRE